jgi:hypothetical protein
LTKREEPLTDTHRSAAENQANPDAPSTARRTSWLAWALAGLSVAMFVASATLTIMSLYGAPQALPPSSWGIAQLVIFLPFLAFPVVGALIASNRPRNPIGWICLTAGLFWMLIVLGDSIPGSGPYQVTISALTQWTWVPPVGLLGIYMILLFTDGKLPSRRWRPLVWFSGAVMVSVSVAVTIAPGQLQDHPRVRNPFGLEGYPMVVQVLTGTIVLLPICILASAASLFVRYRHSGGEVRQQIKWVAFAASLVGVVYLSAMVIGLFFTPEAIWGSADAPLLVDILLNTVLMSYAGVPVAVGFAVLRYRLYDIDILINRTLVYGTLTATLALIYVGCVVVMQYAFRVLTGQETQLAIVASTLVIAAMFGPLRRRVQAFVDRRFFRKKYDAQETLETFSSRLRDETDLEQLNVGLLTMVRETLQPAQVSLWLRPDRAAQGTEEQDR